MWPMQANGEPMRKRYLYSLIFGIPGFFVSVFISSIIFGGIAGVLWLFVFGDNPWPAYADTLLAILFVLVFLTVWLATITLGFIIGRRLEQNPVLNKNHILSSLGITAIFVLFILFQQLSVGNLGPKSEGEHCMDFCIQEGYSASSIPAQDTGERSCSCLDGSGNEIITVPLDSIDSAK